MLSTPSTRLQMRPQTCALNTIKRALKCAPSTPSLTLQMRALDALKRASSIAFNSPSNVCLMPSHARPRCPQTRPQMRIINALNLPLNVCLYALTRAPSTSSNEPSIARPQHPQTRALNILKCAPSTFSNAPSTPSNAPSNAHHQCPQLALKRVLLRPHTCPLNNLK
jgi:hypothetical protein